MEQEYRIDPWGTAVRVEYDKLFKYFGISEFAPLLPRVREVFGEPLYLMRRGVIFGHRDYERILEAYKSRDRVALVTGFMPSGKFHFGHKMLVEQVIYYQKLGFEIFLVLADAEAYVVRKLDRRDVIDYALYEYVANFIALGLEKNKHTHIYFQTNYEKPYYRLIQMFSRKVTTAEMEAIYGSIDPGKIVASLTQVADILHPQLEYFGGFRHVLVPVGADQDPHIRLTRDMADRFKTELGLERPASTYHRFQMGLDGNKMSSSRPEYTIFLTDPPEVAAEKLKRALTGGRATVEEQKKLGGVPESCSIYEFYVYHLVLSDKELYDIYRRCREGRLLCGECKSYAVSLLVKYLEEHQKKLEKARDKVYEYVEPPQF